MGIIFGLLRRAANSAQDRRNQDRIRRNNDRTRNVNHYFSAPVESYVEDNINENVIISGNNKDIRDRVCSRAAHASHNAGNSVIVLHCGNRGLENLLERSFFNENCLTVVNNDNRVYDPFYNLDKNQIAELVLASTTEHNSINNVGGTYIKGLTDFLITRNRNVSARTFMNCPHDEMLSIVNRLSQEDRSFQEQSTLIYNEISKGNIESGSIEQYFRRLSLQGDCILADKNAFDNNSVTNVYNEIRNRNVLCLDMVSANCDLLINIIIYELQMAMGRGNRFTIVLDSIPMEATENLGRFLKNFSSNCNYIYSARDVYSETLCTANLFDTLIGRANSVFISQHDSATSAERFSNYFGKFQRTEINASVGRANNRNTFGQILPGDTNNTGYTTSIAERFRVEPTDITGLANNMLYIKKQGTNEIIYLNCTEGNAIARYNRPNRAGNPVQTSYRFNWFIFILLTLLFFPIGLVYGFVTSGRTGKITIAIITILSILLLIIANNI